MDNRDQVVIDDSPAHNNTSADSPSRSDPARRIGLYLARLTGRLLLTRQALPFAALLGLILAFASTPNFLTLFNLNSILRSLPVLTLIAVGSTFPILIGSIDLSASAILTLSAGTGAVLVPQFGEAALLLAIPVGLLAGCVNGAVIAYGRLPSFLVTLGTLFVANGLAIIVMDGVPHPFVGDVSQHVADESLRIGGLQITYLTLIALGLAGVMSIFAIKTRWGRHIYAVGGNELVARLSGINVNAYKVLAFGLSGLFAGTAGLCLASIAQSAQPGMGDSYFLPAIAAVVVGGTSLLGGIGGPQWTVLGALVLLTLDDGMVIAGIDPNYQTVLRGIVIVIAAALTLRRVGGVVK